MKILRNLSFSRFLLTFCLGTVVATAASAEELKLNSTVQRTPTLDGAEYNRQAHGSNSSGELWSADTTGKVTRSGAESATYDIEKEVTGKKGNSYTVDRSGTVTKTDNGLQTSGQGSYTGPKGRTATSTYDGSTSKTESGFKHEAARAFRGEEGRGWNARAEVIGERRGDGNYRVNSERSRERMRKERSQFGATRQHKVRTHHGRR